MRYRGHQGGIRKIKFIPIFLDETDLIRGGAAAGTAVHCTISYEIMDDA